MSSTAPPSVTLAVGAGVFAELVARLAEPLESAAVLFAREVTTDVDAAGPVTTLVATGLQWVPQASYRARTCAGLDIDSTGWVPALSRAARGGLVPVFLHTHPGGSPAPSRRDKIVNAQLRQTAAARDGRAGIGTLILGGTAEQPCVSGTFAPAGGLPAQVGRLRVVGAISTVLLAQDDDQDGSEAGHLPIFDRQVRALGADGQALLGALRVGVVGAGGTGSAVAEQLLRLGVGELVVIDDQRLTDANVTRVYGSGLTDVGRPKVDLVADQAARVGLETVVRTARASVGDPQAAALLAHCDVVFGCTDDHAGRGVLTRLPSQLLTTFVDCGVVVDSVAGVVQDVLGRVTVVTPGGPCLFCTGDIDPVRARAEMLAPDELARVQADGYAPELDTPDPAVVAYTTLVAATAVSEMLDRLILHSVPDPAPRLLLRLLDRAVSRQRPRAAAGHWCFDGAAACAVRPCPAVGHQDGAA